MRMTKPLAVVVAVTLLTFAATASAQVKADQYSYHFDDDFMVGDTLGTTPLVTGASAGGWAGRPGGSSEKLLDGGGGGGEAKPHLELFKVLAAGDALPVLG